jgi:hypothetical protein
MVNEHGHDEELFAIVCENALNGIDPEALTDDEMEKHRKWVAKNWDYLNVSMDD